MRFARSPTIQLSSPHSPPRVAKTRSLVFSSALPIMPMDWPSSDWMRPRTPPGPGSVVASPSVLPKILRMKVSTPPRTDQVRPRTLPTSPLMFWKSSASPPSFLSFSRMVLTRSSASSSGKWSERRKPRTPPTTACTSPSALPRMALMMPSSSSSLGCFPPSIPMIVRRRPPMSWPSPLRNDWIPPISESRRVPTAPSSASSILMISSPPKCSLRLLRMLASSGMISPTSFRTIRRIWWTPEKGFSSTQPRPWTMPPTRVTTRSTSPTTASSMPPRKPPIFSAIGESAPKRSPSRSPTALLTWPSRAPVLPRRSMSMPSWARASVTALMMCSVSLSANPTSSRTSPKMVRSRPAVSSVPKTFSSRHLTRLRMPGRMPSRTSPTWPMMDRMNPAAWPRTPLASGSSSSPRRMARRPFFTLLRPIPIVWATWGGRM
mmetsp:Transcript_19092/g.64362  ORF Transcript_19092/g.64362 Transcript_19092/m.64362 type:complete len:434 (+) Transcript_19092:387-1688(+)